MTRTLFLVAALLTACSPADEDGSSDLLTTYEAEMDELREALDTYITGVDTAPDLLAVSDLQTTYDADADHAIEGLEHALADIEGCSHMDDGATRVVDAKASLQAIHAAIEEVITAHPLHTDVTECQTLATSHEQVISAEMTTMAEHHDAWSGMSCEMHQDDGGAEDKKH